MPLVVVMAMVDAQKSGVLITVDPATGDPAHLVVASAWGLGETVVGGQVEPDHFVIQKRDLTIVERRIAHKAFELVRGVSGAGTAQRPVPARSVSLKEARRVAEKALAMESADEVRDYLVGVLRQRLPEIPLD